MAHFTTIKDNFKSSDEGYLGEKNDTIVLHYILHNLIKYTFSTSNADMRFLLITTMILDVVLIFGTILLTLLINENLLCFQVDNFVHADMHPGNILVRIKERTPGTQLFESRPHVIFLDVGMTAELSKRDRMNIVEFFKAVALRDGHTAAQCTLQFSERQSCPNPGAFVEVLATFTAPRILVMNLSNQS